MAGLKNHGIAHTVMLTGDNPLRPGRSGPSGVDEVAAELPQDKVRAVQELMTAHGGVAMVGDGDNGAGIATATVGIAMGGAGTDGVGDSRHRPHGRRPAKLPSPSD